MAVVLLSESDSKMEGSPREEETRRDVERALPSLASSSKGEIGSFSDESSPSLLRDESRDSSSSDNTRFVAVVDERDATGKFNNKDSGGEAKTGPELKLDAGDELLDDGEPLPSAVNPPRLVDVDKRVLETGEAKLPELPPCEFIAPNFGPLGLAPPVLVDIVARNDSDEPREFVNLAS